MAEDLEDTALSMGGPAGTRTKRFENTAVKLIISRVFAHSEDCVEELFHLVCNATQLVDAERWLTVSNDFLLSRCTVSM
jgi:hypothetical protein